MSAGDGIEIARGELLRLVSAGRVVVPKFTPAQPVDWNPGQVTDPKTGLQFTHKTCWYFIERHLSDGHEIEMIVLDLPKGTKAYVMIVDIGPHVSDVYIKLQIGSGQVIGRSFHYSTQPKRRLPGLGES